MKDFIIVIKEGLQFTQILAEGDDAKAALKAFIQLLRDDDIPHEGDVFMVNMATAEATHLIV